MLKNGQEHKLPSVAELQKFIRDKVKVEFIMSNSARFVGTLRWFDEYCFAITQDSGDHVTLVRACVLGYRPQKPS
jgi:small nuclear ribonucleoprotein (snRNP)-like protein